MIDIHNFDFLIGKWNVLNRRLKVRMNNCEEWIEFSAEMETKPILNGLGIMDEMKSAHFGDKFVGLSIRILNPVLNEWTIFWADTANPEIGLKEQVVGKFENGIGIFFGEEFYIEKKYNLRFLWKKETPNTALWEQAYYDEATQVWETNWTMFFTAVE